MVSEIECPYCHKIMDKRGYNSHVRACEAKDKIKQEELKKEEERMTENEDKQKQKEDTDSKNPKTSLLMKVILLIVGAVVIVISLILMLISPKSKESKEPTLREQQVNRRLRSR